MEDDLSDDQVQELLEARAEDRAEHEAEQAALLPCESQPSGQLCGKRATVVHLDPLSKQWVARCAEHPLRGLPARCLMLGVTMVVAHG